MPVPTTHRPPVPFPKDIATHPLLVVDYELIAARNESEIDKLFEACKNLGFFYLKNHGVDPDPMFEMGSECFQLPLKEKMKYEQGDSGSSFGYKASGACMTDEFGNLDTPEFINVSKDDALSYPEVAHRTYPSAVENRMPDIASFVAASRDVSLTILRSLTVRLGLPESAVIDKHGSEPSPSELRVIRNPPPKDLAAALEKAAIGAHTDFGTFSFLHSNMTGGLQVLPPGTDKWQYIKPIEGHAVCNLGDAMAIYSGGLLRSNLHRVVPPPGEQGKYPRFSCVYFTRPAFDSILEPLDSPVVKEAYKSATFKVPPGTTSRQWFTRRIAGQRTKNRTGPETWRGSRGTEHVPEAV